MTAPAFRICPLSRKRERVRVRAAALPIALRFLPANALTPALSPRGEGAKP
jgi:hypothetical protein